MDVGLPVRPCENEISTDATAPVPLSASAFRAPDLGAEAERHVSRQVLAVPLAFVLAAAAFVLVLASNLLSLRTDHLRTTLINANWEFSWSHDAATLLLGIGVWTSLIGARATRADRRLWLATAAIPPCSSWMRHRRCTGQLGNLDKLLYVPILAALVVCVWRLAAGTRERALVACGLTTLLLAFAMHVAGLHLLRPLGYNNYVYQSGVGFKEGTELAGLMLLVTALWRRARQAMWRCLARASGTQPRRWWGRVLQRAPCFSGAHALRPGPAVCRRTSSPTRTA